MDPPERGHPLRTPLIMGGAMLLSAAALAALTRVVANVVGARNLHVQTFRGNANEVVTITPNCTVGYGTLQFSIELTAGSADVQVVESDDLDPIGHADFPMRLSADGAGPRRITSSQHSTFSTGWQVRITPVRDGTAGRVFCDAQEATP